MGKARVRASRLPRLSVRSTRTRVLGWFMLIVAIALGLNIAAVDEFMHARARSATGTELQHEVVKFRDYASRALDPTTGKQFSTAGDLLRTYLAEVVPDEHEAMFKSCLMRQRVRCAVR